jgi:predicted ABC-type ATPase
METKRLRIFAGPNGSGKSSLYSYLISQHYFNSYYYINADDIAKELPTKGFSTKNRPLIVTKNSLITYVYLLYRIL